ncbi:hypothetical protein [Mesorhizobium sp. SARCC-RB16n]|uniref:hypothetical protein n=1 Tax=Mesorhizobium sp. SARCC-RB16n TaxID=2116687 RepID=UPI00122EDE2C|nr:hypothetical protein [Mesorhizobium sp. SARCC-RB16n]
MTSETLPVLQGRIAPQWPGIDEFESQIDPRSRDLRKKNSWAVVTPPPGDVGVRQSFEAFALVR